MKRYAIYMQKVLVNIVSFTLIKDDKSFSLEYQKFSYSALHCRENRLSKGKKMKY